MTSGDAVSVQSSEAEPLRRRLSVWAAALLLLAVAAAWFLWDGLVDAHAQSNKTRCLTNERRLTSALLLYSQDHDGRLPPPAYTGSDGQWRNWYGLLQSYLPPDETFVCPDLDISGARDPRGFDFPTSYALNGRFFGTFSPGAFPVENLELPGATAMLVEAGATGSRPNRTILSVYSDIAGRQSAFPSPHDDRMNVAAADGHIVTLKLAHYRPENHDPLYGRMGGSIYNWNGGHPNGDTGGPPRE